MQRNSYRRCIQCSESREREENCHYPSRQGTCAACDALGSDIYVAGECLIISIRGSDGPLQRHTAHSSHTCGKHWRRFYTVLTAVARSYQSYNTRWPSRLLAAFELLIYNVTKELQRHQLYSAGYYNHIIILLGRRSNPNKEDYDVSKFRLLIIFFRKSFINV